MYLAFSWFVGVMPEILHYNVRVSRFAVRAHAGTRYSNADHSKRELSDSGLCDPRLAAVHRRRGINGVFAVT